MADQNPPTDPVEPEAKKGKAKAAAEETVAMRCEGAPWSGTLRIGHEEIEVVDGVAQVPTRLHAGAHHAGFR